MTQYIKPAVKPAWAEDKVGVVADLLMPADADIKTGWPLSVIPPTRQRFNWLQNYLANGLRYLMQRGLSDWDATEDYRAGDFVRASDGKTYRSILTGINKDPAAGANPLYWVRWGYTVSELQAEIIANAPPQPTGSINYFPSIAAPTGFIKANGALLSRATYAALWAFAQASGNISANDGAWLSGGFSPGDGATTFRIPDWRGYHMRSFDDGRGIDGGRAIGTVQADQLLAHGHGVTDPTHQHGITDPSHAHAVSDPGHTHGFGAASNIANGGGSPSAFNAGATGVTQAAATGIGIFAAVTGVTANYGPTGVTVNTSAGGAETRVKNIAALACIKY